MLLTIIAAVAVTLAHLATQVVAPDGVVALLFSWLGDTVPRFVEGDANDTRTHAPEPQPAVP